MVTVNIRGAVKSGVFVGICLGSIFSAAADGPPRPVLDDYRYPPPRQERDLPDTYRREDPPRRGWTPRNLLQGPAAIVKGVGASLWCIGSSSYQLFHDVDNFGEGFVATLLWPFAITIDSVGSAAAYLGIGTAHTITGGALISEPPKQIEEMNAPIYCVLSDNYPRQR